MWWLLHLPIASCFVYSCENFSSVEWMNVNVGTWAIGNSSSCRHNFAISRPTWLVSHMYVWNWVWVYNGGCRVSALDILCLGAFVKYLSPTVYYVCRNLSANRNCSHHYLFNYSTRYVCVIFRNSNCTSCSHTTWSCLLPHVLASGYYGKRSLTVVWQRKNERLLNRDSVCCIYLSRSRW